MRELKLIFQCETWFAIQQHVTYKHLLILSTAAANFCSSSGQMSGQWVNPKYINVHLPKKSFSVTRFPWWLVSSNGPPIAAFPAEGPCLTSCEALCISTAIKVESNIWRKCTKKLQNSNQIDTPTVIWSSPIPTMIQPTKRIQQC